MTPEDSFWKDFFCVAREYCILKPVQHALYGLRHHPILKSLKGTTPIPQPPTQLSLVLCRGGNWHSGQPYCMAKEPEVQKGGELQEVGEAWPTWDLFLQLLPSSGFGSGAHPIFILPPPRCRARYSPVVFKLQCRKFVCFFLISEQ